MIGGKKYSDSELVRLLKGRPKDQDKALYYFCASRKIRRSIFQQVKQYRGSDQDVDDILQDSLIILINKVRQPDFEAKSALNSFLIGIIRNKCKEKYLRKTKVIYVENQEDFTKDLASIPAVDTDLIQNEKEQVFNEVKRWLYQQIGEICQKVLEMDINGFSRAEIAEEMDWKNVQSAKNKVLSCRKKLRQAALSNPTILESINL